MSLAAGEVKPPNYETICNNAPTTIPMPNVPLATYRHDVYPSAPAYQGFSDTQTWNVPTVAPQWELASSMPPRVDSSAPFFQTFLKGKPKALGILVIVAAIIEIALGIALACTGFSITAISGIPFWGAIFYIIAGSLTIAAQRKPNICLVRGSLSLNIISTFFTTVALILNATDFPITILSYSSDNYYNSNYNNYNNYNSPGNPQSYYNGGTWNGYNQLNGAFAALSLLIITNVLLFCVTLSTSIFGCRSLCKVQPQVPQVFLIQNDAVIPVNPGAPPSYCVQMPPPPPPLYPVNEVKAIPTN